MAEALGINLYAKQLVDGRDRRKLERLCRYVMRPPLSEERLARRDDGRLELTLKSVWRDGTRALLFTRDDLLVRLCSAVPQPCFNMVRYFGVLSSHCRQRAEVVPAAPTPERFVAEPAPGDQLALFGPLARGADGELGPAPSSGRSRWAFLLRHVFGADIETCSRCGGPMRWVELATHSDAIRRLLVKHGLAPQPPPAPSLPLPIVQLALPFSR